MQFRINDTAAIVSEFEFRAMHPNVSFPADITEEALESFGAVKVEQIARPEHTAYQTVEDTGVQLDEADGKWKQTFAVVDITDAAVIASIDKEKEKKIIDVFVGAVQSMLNATAMKKGYDSIRSAALRAGYPGPFHAEGVEYAVWMDECWAECYRLMAEVKAGTRAVPTVEELLAEMPAEPVFA